MPITNEAWYSPYIMTEKMRGHIERVRALREARLTASHIVETIARWRIIPLKCRDLACTYSRVERRVDTSSRSCSLLRSLNPLVLNFNLDLQFQKC